MKNTARHYVYTAVFASIAGLMTAESSAGLIVYDAGRVSIDAVVGERQESAPALGYYEGATDVSSTLVGMTGSNENNTRYGQDLVYRYALPVLSPGETIESFTLTFQITALRDHSQNDYELDVYLLDLADPTTTGSDLFFRGANDSNHAFVGSHYIDTGNDDGSITLDPPVDVTFTVASGAALTVLQSFYDGNHTPNQTEASFRFNLDKAYTGGISSRALNRYYVNDDVDTSGFTITAVPEPSAFVLLAVAVLGLLGFRRRR